MATKGVFRALALAALLVADGLAAVGPARAADALDGDPAFGGAPGDTRNLAALGNSAATETRWTRPKP